MLNSHSNNSSSSIEISPSLKYGEKILRGNEGFHIMDIPSDHWVETLTGIGASGVEMMLTFVEGNPLQVHPLIPLLQFTVKEIDDEEKSGFDLVVNENENPVVLETMVMKLICQVASRKIQPRLFQKDYSDFQITRGRFGVSL